MAPRSTAGTRPLGTAPKPQSSSEIARQASTRLVAKKPHRLTVIAISDGYDGLRVYKAGERFQIALRDKDEELPAWVVTEREWTARAEQLADDEEDTADDEIAASLWREREEALVTATAERIKAERTKQAREQALLATA